MAYERPAWAGGAEPAPQNMPQQKNVVVDVGEFIRTRDALTAAYLGLSVSLDRAVKAYLDHTQVVLNGDASLNVSHLIQPFNVLTNHAQNAQIAQMALQQQTGGAPPMVVANGAPAVDEEPLDGKKKRKKRAYKPRDPNAPKRPLTAYFRFLGENRGTISKEISDNPERFADSGKPGDISKVATERWHALSHEQQQPYRDAYQAALKEYEKEVEKYKASGGRLEDLDETKVDEALVDPAAQLVPATVDPDTDSSDDSDEEVEPVAPPPPPPVKAPKKAAAKKGKPTTVAPAQVFPDINPENIVPTPAPVAAAPSSSPDRKRRAATEGEGSSKKRGRKGGAAAEVVAAPDPAPVAAPVSVAPLASSPDAEPASKKKKKDKKKKKGDDA